MSHEYETVAWVRGSTHPILTAVVVCYEIDDDLQPEIGDIVEAADPENVINTILLEGEESVIYEKVSQHVFENKIAEAENYYEGER